MGNFKPSDKDNEILKKANIRGNIKAVRYFLNGDKKYVTIINKVARLYSIRLINYEDNDEDEVQVIAVKRFPDLIGFYSTKEEAHEEVGKIRASQELINQCVYEYETQEDDSENILIFGLTGAGKSTLANVISGTDEFKEGAGLISETENFQIQNFEWNGTKFRVVDTIGVGDNRMTQEDVLYKIGEAIHSMKNGIKQVFVVVGLRFSDKDFEAVDLLKKNIFEKDITKYITIIKTHFDDFKNPVKCNQDKEMLMKKNKNFANLLKSCNGRIIYVDNPRLSIDDKERSEMNLKIRRESREILLNHLQNSCNGSYKLGNWDDICVKINDFMNAKKWKEEHGNPSVRDKLEIKAMKKEIVKEVENQLVQLEKTRPPQEAEISADIPAIGKFYLKFKNCCTIS